MQPEHDEAAPVCTDALATEHTFDIAAFADRHSGITVSKHKPGTMLFSQGEPANSAYFVHQGRVRITTVSAQGKEATVAIIDAGDFCGEGCLIGDRKRVASATCISNCTVARLEQGSAIRALRQDHVFSEFFVARILTNLVQLREVVASHIIDSSEVRLARILMQLANYSSNNQMGTAISNVSQDVLAHMVGTTRPRINYFMNKFRKLGHVQYNGATIVVHKSLLSVILGED